MVWKVISKIRAGKIYTIVLLDESTGDVKSEKVQIYVTGDKLWKVDK